MAKQLRCDIFPLRRPPLAGTPQRIAKSDKALILDVRPNSGGDELLARRVAGWFVPKGSFRYAQHRARLTDGTLGPAIDRKVKGNTDGQRVTCPVFLLVGPTVMSSAEAFVLMMKQAPTCTVVGSRTAGSSGNPQAHKLPNGVTVWIPSWQAMDASGESLEGRGITPDVAVPGFRRPGVVDPTLHRALELAQPAIR